MYRTINEIETQIKDITALLDNNLTKFEREFTLKWLTDLETELNKTFRYLYQTI